MSGPTDLNLYLTSKCNAHCPYCSRQLAGPPDAPDMTAELVADILAHYPSIRSVCLAGFGEPLLCPDLPRIAKLCGNRGLMTGLITNGYLLPEMAEEINTWGLGYISMSTADRKHGDHSPGPIAAMAKIKVQSARYVSHVLSPGNVDELYWAVSLAITAAAQTVLHAPLPPAPDLTAQDWEEIETIRDTPAFGPPNVSIWPMRRDGDNPHRCGSTQSIGVDGAGRVTWCRRVQGPGEGSPHYTDHAAVEAARSEQARRIACGDGNCGVCWGNWRG